MANKPIISIDIDDAAFKRFLGLYNEYKDSLGTMPELWADIGSAIGDAGEGIASSATGAKEALAMAGAQAALIAEALKDATAAQNEFGRSTGVANKGMGEIAKTAKGLGNTIFGISTSILKWGSIGLGALGLGGLFAGLGVGNLADKAFETYKTAGGLGLTPGQLKSYQVNAQQFLGMPELQAAAAAQVDITKIPALTVLRINPKAAQHEPATNLAFQALQSAATAYREAQKSKTTGLFEATPVYAAYQALGGTIEDIRNAAAHPEAFAAAQGKYQRGIAPLDFTDATGQALADLKIKLDEAGAAIDTDLFKPLSKLSPQLEKLTDEVVGAFGAFIKGPEAEKLLDDVEFGLQSLIDLLTPQNVAAWGKNINTLFHEIGVVADKLKWLLPKPTTNDDVIWGDGGFQWNQNAPDVKAVKAALAWIKSSPQEKFRGSALEALLPGVKLMGTQAEIAFRREIGEYAPDRIKAYDVLAEAKYGLPAGIMDRLAQDESGMGKNLVSPAGALGPYQFMPAVAKEMNIDPLDLRMAAGAAGKKLRSLFDKYHNWDKAIAAYNLGPNMGTPQHRGLDYYLKTYGADWLRHVPAETRGEVANVRPPDLRTVLADDMKAHGASWQRFLSQQMREQVQSVVPANAPPGSATIDRIVKGLRERRTMKPVQVSITNSTSARTVVSANAASYG